MQFSLKYAKHGIALALVGLAGMSAVGSSTKRAEAAVTSGQTVSCAVEYVQYSEEVFQISCGGVIYTTFGPGWTACTSRQTFETIKHFDTLATSAFLSGKKLLINFNKDSSQSCGGPNFVNLPLATLLRIHD
jgi:hypothetical protein